jgi:hypothetical protein
MSTTDASGHCLKRSLRAQSLAPSSPTLSGALTCHWSSRAIGGAQEV